MARYSAGTAYVQIVPSLRGFPTKVRSQLAKQRMDHVVRVVPKLDTTVARAQADAAAVKARRTVPWRVDLDTQTALKKITTLSAAVRKAGRVTLSVAGAASTVQTLAGVTAAAGQASGALLLLPAAGAAAGAVFGTLALGTRGFGDALKAMGDPAKFAQALAGLAPAARETALAIQGLRPAFAGLRLGVQQRLFVGLGAVIGTLAAAYLPVLHDGLGGIATALNTTAHALAGFLVAPQTLGDTATILGNVRAALVGLAPVGVAVGQIFRDLAAVGSSFLPGLASGLAGAAQRLADVVASARQTGQLGALIANGLSALSQLGQVLRNLASIVGSVFGALNASGTGFLGVLVALTGRLAAFFKSAEGMRMLDALAAMAATAGQVLSEVLGVALAQLAPLIVTLAPAFTQLVTQLGSALVNAMIVAGPLLQQLAQFLADNATWLVPVVTSLGALIAVTGPLITVFNFLVTTVRVVTAAFHLFKLALLSNPFTAIALGITTLAVLIITNWDTIKAVTLNVWRIVSDWVRDRVQAVIAAVNWLGSLPGRVGAWFSGVYHGAVSALGDLVAWVRSLPGRILSALGDLGGLLVGGGRDMISGLIRGLGQAAAQVGRFLLRIVQDAVGGVLRYLGIASPSKLMTGIGAQTAEGFTRGITSGVPAAARAAQALASTAAIPPVTATGWRASPATAAQPPGWASAAPAVSANGRPQAVLTTGQWKAMSRSGRETPGEFRGQLYLESGEFLGRVRGEVHTALDAVGTRISYGTR